MAAIRTRLLNSGQPSRVERIPSPGPVRPGAQRSVPQVAVACDLPRQRWPVPDQGHVPE